MYSSNEKLNQFDAYFWSIISASDVHRVEIPVSYRGGFIWKAPKQQSHCL